MSLSILITCLLDNVWILLGEVRYKSLQNFYWMSLSILITCLLDNVWILLGEVRYKSLPGVKELSGYL